MTTWVLLAGLPATGKSMLAEALKTRLGTDHNVIILSKDGIRAVLFPGVLTDYTREQDDLCMRAILDAASYLTEYRRVDFIFFDGRTFSQPEQIEEVLRAAQRAAAAWRILHLACSDDVAAARLSQTDPAHPAKNRDIALYTRMQRDFAPISFPHLKVDTSGGIEPRMDAVLEYLQVDAVP